MDDSLTSQAIAELMCEIEKQNTTSTVQQERKVNPLGGKPNKNFLGRTINSALNYNRRESERTYANCQQKLQELDDRYERRKYNSFYNRSRSRSRSRRRRQSSSSISNRSRSQSGSKSRRRSKKKYKKKHKKTSKKHKKSKHRRPSTSSSNSSKEEKDTSPVSNDQLTAPTVPPSELSLQHSKHITLAVAAAYAQSLYAQSSKDLSNETVPAVSSMSEIFKELMSDEDEDEDASKKEAISKQPLESLSLSSSSDSDQKTLIINVETEEENDESSRESFHHSETSSGSSCITLEDSADERMSQYNDTSDLEIIELKPEHQAKPLVVEQKSEPETTTVDLTDD